MSKIWEFFDTLDEIVYVSDINSHELIYMNQKALRTYGFHSLDEITGKKCYEVLQNCSSPCSMCNNHKLKRGYFMEWWYSNPLLERQLMLKDTLVVEDGKEYRMELAIDSDRQELLDKLKKMGYLDQLTQIGNRHAMSEYINNLQNEQSLGIVYCDVTGLKQVNDRKGHAFGDKLIIDACEGLKKIFGEYGLFRIGGDELLALCTEIDESALWQGVEQLKQDLQNSSIHVAIGGLWEKDSFGGVDRLIAEAERQMYKDKAAYYRKYGFDRRHSMETVANWL
ncbi:MAG: diguanylate cyclase [Lachnospiraceae bacterium]|nr:diguanylate cyclase [Lachnospiraceae bacterium]